MASEYDLTGSEGLLDEGDLTEARVRVGLSSPVSPDKQAAIVDLARRSNLPVDVVSRNYDAVVKRQENAELPFDKIQQQTPRLAEWLAAAPENGGLIKDDLHQMGALEWMLSAPQTAYKRGEAQMQAGRLRFQSIFADLTPEDQASLDESVKAMGGESLGAETWFGKALVGGAQIAPQLVEQTARGLHTGTKLAAVGGLAATAAGPAAPVSVPTAIALGYGVGLRSEAAILSFEQEAGHAYAEMRQVKDENGNAIDPAAAKAAAIAIGAVNAGLEVAGLDILLKSIPGGDKLLGKFTKEAVKDALTVPTVRDALTNMVKTYGGVLAKETSVEVAQRAVTILGDEIARQKSDVEGRPVGEIGADLGQEAIGAAQAFTYIAGPGAVMGGANDVMEVRKARERQQFFEALGTATSGTKLSQRLPDKLREFVANVTKDGPLETVYIPAAEFQTLFHAHEQDAGEVVQKLTGDRSGFDEAISSGGDFAIPMSVYAAKIAPTEMNAELSKIIRIRPGEMNAVEAEQFLADAEADAHLPPEPDPVDVVRQDIIGQLLASNYDRSTAEAMAEVQAQFYASQAAKLGVSPAELLRQYPVTVALDIPDVLAKVGTVDELDNLIDRYRAGQIPDEKTAMGETLSEFIARNGGMVDDGGELKARDLDKRKAGKHNARLMRDGGLTIEKMTEKAWGAGFIPEYDQAQFFDALDNDLSGNHVYSSGNVGESTHGVVLGDPVARAELDRFNALHNWITEQGIDIHAMSTADIKALLTKPEGQTLNQLPETIDVDGVSRPTLNSNGRPIAATEGGIRNFWRWFGDSKVVDKDGRPLVVYHGTDADVTEFSKKFQGRATRATSSKDGFFFASSPRTAKSYADHAATVAPVQELIDKADKAGNRGDWDEYDRLIVQAEALESDIHATPDGRARGQNVMPVYLSIQNPLEIDAGGENPSGIGGIDPLIKKAKRAGHDGAIIRNFDDAAHLYNDIADHFIAFSPEQIKSATGNRGTFDPDSPNILYQEGDRDLIVQHNLSEANLLHASRMGGIPVPSLAITSASAPMTGFGEITLLGDPAMADPNGYAKSQVFGADIYSPRYPDVHVKLSNKARDKLNDVLKPYIQQDKPLDGGGWQAPRTKSFYGADLNKVDDLAQSNDFKAYAAEKGVDVNSISALRVVAEELLREVGAEEQIFRGYTNAGNRRYVPHTLENVVKILKKELRGGEGFNYGVGSLRAKYTEKFRSVAQIKKAKKRLVTKEQFKEIKKEVDDEFWSLAERLTPHHAASGRFGFGDTVISTLQDAATMGMRRALVENGFSGEVDDAILKDIGEFLVKLRNLPTEYFEAKILRDVDLAEFRVAVAPSTISSEARRVLESRGLKVVTYESGNAFEVAHAKAVTDAASEFSDIVMFQPDGSGPRASITFPADRSRFDIRLLKTANLSSFLHESGHQFFEIVGHLVETGRATPEMQKDYQILLDWLGVKSRAEITVEHHEKLARGFEAYLREGKAPSIALRPMFARFRAWLVGIYRQAKALNVELTDEVRGVMDRLLATDDQIAAAESEAGVMAAFATAEDAGMSATEFAAYRETITTASEQARDTLQAKLMAQLAREQKKWWKDESDKIRREVTDHVNTLKEYFALSVLQKGVMPDGSALPEGMRAIRLSKNTLEEAYGNVTRPKGVPKQQVPASGMLGAAIRGTPTTSDETFSPNTVMNRLAALRVWGKDGMHQDVAAEYLGYKSGNDLVMALVNIRPKKDLIEAETQRRMLELYPDIRFDGSLAGEAAAAVQNDGREKVLRIELAALRKKAREVRPFVRAAEKEANAALKDEKQAGAQALRDQANTQRQAQRAGLQAIRTGTPSADLLKEVARRTIAAKRIRDINPEQYLATARWQAKKAIEAAAMGSKPIPSKNGVPGYESGYAWAADLKQREILNHYLYREALRAKDAVDSALSFIKKAESKKSRDRMALAGYLDQWDALLERFSFKRVSPKKADRKAALAAWVSEQEEAGLPVNIPDHVLDEARREPYINLTFEELAGLVDSLKQIRRFASLVTKLNANQDKREWQAAKAELLAAALASSKGGKGNPISPFEDGPMKSSGRAIGELADGILRPETIIEWLDSGDSGPWHDYFWDAANKAEHSRETLRKKIVEPLYKLATNITMARSRELNGFVSIPGLGSLNRRTLISMALNMGNAGNLERLMKGGIREGAGIRQLSEQDIANIKAALTAEDWQMVQTIWDTIDQLWPMIRDLEERLTGQAPDRVEAVPVVTDHGTFRGGYFPVVYDPYASKAGRKQAEAGTTTDKMFSNFTQAVTGKSHTKGRVAVGGPLLLDYGRVVTRHVDQVITDLTHREFVIDALRILNDREISLAIQDRQGTMALSSLNGMLRHAVHSDYGFTDAADRGMSALMSRMVSNVAVMALGFKAVTAFGNAVLAPIQAMSRIEKQWILRGFGQFYAHPKDMTQFIYARSEMMKNRMDNLDDSFVTVVHKLRGKSGLRAQVARASMSIHWGADWITSHALWLGRYQQALQAGETEAKAVKLADKAIRTTQTAGAPKDLSSLERNPKIRETGLTMFMGPLVIMNNRISEAIHKKGVVKSWPESLGVLMASWFLPAIVWELATGRGPDEDDDPALWALRKLFIYPFMGYPLLRDLLSVADARADGVRVSARPVPAADALVTIYDAGVAALEAGVEMAEGGDPDTEKLTKKMLKAVGVGVGLPAGQAAITGGFIHDLYTGEYSPETPLDWRYLVVRRPKDD